MESKTNKIFVRKLPRKEVFINSLGYLPNTFLAGIFMLMHINFFWNYLGLIDPLFIIGMIIYAKINALNDLLTGHMNDTTNIDKWGSRRLIYLKYYDFIQISFSL